MGLRELLEALEPRLEDTGAGGYTILVISSPTGFTERAIEYTTGEGDRLGLIARNVTLYLVDPVAGRLYYNPRDRAAAENREIAEPRVPEEKLARVLEYLQGDEARRQALLNSPATPFLTSAWVAEKLGEEPHVVRRAMAILEERGLGRVRAGEDGSVAFFYNTSNR